MLMKTPVIIQFAAAGILSFLLSAEPLKASTGNVAIQSQSGVTAALNPETGSYKIGFRRPGWDFEGTLGRALERVTTGRGIDRIGAYDEIDFSSGTSDPFAGTIRIYDAKPAVLFSLTNLRTADSMSVDFPRFTVFPRNLHHFSYQDKPFAPCTFALVRASTPWLLFDDSLNAAILSPANHFFVSVMEGNGVDEIASGMRTHLSGLPAHFTHRTLMAFGRGINRTWDTWGRALTDLSGKSRPSNEADPILRYLGYWTDNGANYYYNYDTTLGYEGTLEKVISRFHEEGIPVRYLQLDSWWYRKSFTGPDGRRGSKMNPRLPSGEWNRFGGTMIYRADTSLFPEGLESFQRKVAVPLATHARWIDPASPYHKDYDISGYAVVDPRWWKATMSYLSSADVICYEQDWLNVISEHSGFDDKPGVGSEFTNEMAAAAKKAGLDMQYCMALPSFFLQGSHFDNLTSIRVSDDRFERPRWSWFLYTSRLASAVGIWPWTDVFMSDERNNLLLSTLSGGPVGIGDKMGMENPGNIKEAVRTDGVIVKPDAPIVPADQMYVAEANGITTPMVAWTYTDHGPIRTVYVFAFSCNEKAGRVNIKPSAFGMRGNVVVYDTRGGAAMEINADRSAELSLGEHGTGYYVIAPVEESGIAFFGDKEQFVCDGRNRIPSLEECPGGLSAVVTFAVREKSVRLFGYSPYRPHEYAVSGKITRTKYDSATHLFELTVSPASAVKLQMPGGEEIRQAVVRITNR